LRKLVLPLVLLAALAAGGHFGWRWWTEGRFIEATDNAYIESNITVVAPKVAGYVTEVAVADNQAVKAGDLLVRIDDADIRARIAQAEAKVAVARANVLSFDPRIALVGANVAEAQATLAAAEAEVARAQVDLLRYQALKEQNVTSAQRLDTALADHRRAVAQRDRARAAIATQQGQTGVLQAARREAEALVAEAEAALATIRVDLSNTVVRAPVAGTVGNRTVQTGQFARAGLQLMVLVPADATYVVANFKETQLSRMRPGQPVKLSVDAFKQHPLQGRIESFAPASGAKFSLLPPENATGNFTKIVQRLPVRIRLDTEDPVARRLVPGLSVEVSVDTREAGTDAAKAPAFGIGAAVAGQPPP